MATNSITATPPNITSQTIFASAGSGKTTQLLNRVIELLALGVLPEKILIISLTNATCREITQRLLQQLRSKDNPPINSKLRVMTIHTFANYILRTAGHTLPVAANTSTKIASSLKYTIINYPHLYQEIMQKFTTHALYLLANKLFNDPNFVEGTMLTAAETAEDILLTFCKHWYRALQASLTPAITFYQQISLASKLLQDPAILFDIYNQLEHLLIDEAQDTTTLQWHLLLPLLKEIIFNDNRKSIFLVGDLQQAVYAFSHSLGEDFFTITKLLQKLSYEQNKAYLVINKTISYRLPDSVLTLGNKLCNLKHTTHNPKEGLVKITLFQNKDEMFQYSLDLLSSLPAHEVLLIAQTRSSNLKQAVIYLQGNGIAINNVDKLKFADHPFFLDMLTIAKARVYTKNNYNLACLARSPLFNIAIDVINNDYITTQFRSLLSGSKLSKIIHSMLPVSLAFYDIFEHFYDQLYKQYGRYVDQLIPAILSYSEEQDSWLDFVNNCETATLNIPPFPDHITVSSVHSSKGTEREIVLLFDASARLPFTHTDYTFSGNSFKIDSIQESFSHQDISAERLRLLYVAITRAKHSLYITGYKHPKYAGSWHDYITKHTDSAESC